jgi:hypothetical protein
MLFRVPIGSAWSPPTEAELNEWKKKEEETRARAGWVKIPVITRTCQQGCCVGTTPIMQFKD